MEKDITYTRLNRKSLWLYPAMMIIAIVGFFLYAYKGWSMFFTCLFTYGIQLAFLMILHADIIEGVTKTISIPRESFKDHLKRERFIRIGVIIMIIIIGILDLFPLYSEDRSFMRFLGINHRRDIGTFEFYFVSMMMILFIYFIGYTLFYYEEGSSDIFKINKSLKRTGMTPDEEFQEEINKIKREEDIQQEMEKCIYGDDCIAIDRKLKIYVNEKDEMLFINGKEYHFNDILSYSVHDNPSFISFGGRSTTKTNTGSMLGRAALGGVVAGGVGAVIGGATAKQKTEFDSSYSSQIHDYEVAITINSISTPLVSISLGDNQDLLNKLSSLLTVIIKRNQ